MQPSNWNRYIFLNIWFRVILNIKYDAYTVKCWHKMNMGNTVENLCKHKKLLIPYFTRWNFNFDVCNSTTKIVYFFQWSKQCTLIVYIVTIDVCQSLRGNKYRIGIWYKQQMYNCYCSFHKVGWIHFFKKKKLDLKML